MEIEVQPPIGNDVRWGLEALAEQVRRCFEVLKQAIDSGDAKVLRESVTELRGLFASNTEALGNIDQQIRLWQ